jgi:hypothetical protein
MLKVKTINNDNEMGMLVKISDNCDVLNLTNTGGECREFKVSVRVRAEMAYKYNTTGSGVYSMT